MKILSYIKKNNGYSLVGAMMLMMTLGFASAGLVTMGTGNTSVTIHDIQSEQAFYIGQAGLEVAAYEVTNGMYVDWGVEKDYADGTYEVQSDPASNILYSKGQMGDSVKNQAISIDFAKDCVGMDNVPARIDNGMGGDPDDNDGIPNAEVHDFQVKKVCNNAFTIKSISIDWNYDNCVLTKNYHNGDDISMCPTTHGTAKVKHVHIDNMTKLYDATKGIGTPSGVMGANPGEEIDITDATFTDQPAHSFYWRMTETVPNGALFHIVIKYTDGTETFDTFQVRQQNQQQPPQNQPPPPQNQGPIFQIMNGAIQVQPNHTFMLQAVCVNLSSAPGVNIPIKTQISSDNGQTLTDLFVPINQGNNYQQAVGNNSTPIFQVRASAEYGAWSASYISSDTPQIQTLVNGQQLPAIPAPPGQPAPPYPACLAPVMDQTGKVVLGPNDILQMFELNTNRTLDPNGPADYQDLVLLYHIQ